MIALVLFVCVLSVRAESPNSALLLVDKTCPSPAFRQQCELCLASGPNQHPNASTSSGAPFPSGVPSAAPSSVHEYSCDHPALSHLRPGMYEGVTANFLSHFTEVSSPMFPLRAEEFTACTGGKILFSEAANIFEDPVGDIGTKSRKGTGLYDAYFMSYSHFPEVSALGLAESLNERIRHSSDKLDWLDILPAVRAMGEFTHGNTTDLDFLMFDGDFFVPVIRLDLWEKHDLPIPNTWQEAVQYADYFNGTDLNDDGEPDYGFCHFPRVGTGYWDWWTSELIYSTWATFDQTQGLSEGFLFDPDTMEPRMTAGFRESVKIWRKLWANGADAIQNFGIGRCAIGYAPPGVWKGVFLNPDGVSRKDANDTVVWQATLSTGELAIPYRFKPFGSTKVVDRETGRLVECSAELCPRAERIPERGHHDRYDRANFLNPSPEAGKLINRAPFFWSGGLGTLIRKSASVEKKDLLWDFFVFTNSPKTSRRDVAAYASWLDSWRYSQLASGDEFLNAGWPQAAYEEHSSVMLWAFSSHSNGAFNLRLPGLKSYTYLTMGKLMSRFNDGELSLDDVVRNVDLEWRERTAKEGVLNQLAIYRASLGIPPLPEFDLCRLHRVAMEATHPFSCEKYDPKASLRVLVVLVPCIVVFLLVLISLVYFFLDQMKRSDSVWKIAAHDLKFDDPPKIIGQGTFGAVLVAEYRGTLTAVKRVLPPQTKGQQAGHDTIMDALYIRRNEEHARNRGMETLRNTIVVGEQTSGDGSRYTAAAKTPSAIKANFVAEMRLLSKLRHPSITTVMGAVIPQRGDPLLVMELMDLGSLHDILHNKSMRFDGGIILRLLSDIAQGLRYLHEAKPPVIHADLKAKNVLLDSRFRAKVTDFGLSGKKHIGAVGTPYFMAPELLQRMSAPTTKTDCYAFGITLYEIISRRDPYEGEDFHSVIKEVADPEINKRPPVPDSCPQKIQSLMTECLDVNPLSRPSFEEIHLQLTRANPDLLEPSLPVTQTEVKPLKYDHFPSHIALALKNGKTVRPEHKKMVTALFLNIMGDVGDEPRSRLFRKIDKLVARCELFRVRTTGSTFLVVGGLESDTNDHPKQVASFAKKALTLSNNLMVDQGDPSKGCFDISIGFHSGPAVGRVVGTKNPQYALLGEAVLTASRLAFECNRIVCNTQTARLLRRQDPSITMLKNSADPNTWWVYEGPKDGNYAAMRFDLVGQTGLAESKSNVSDQNAGRLPFDYFSPV